MAISKTNWLKNTKVSLIYIKHHVIKKYFHHKFLQHTVDSLNSTNGAKQKYVHRQANNQTEMHVAWLRCYKYYFFWQHLELSCILVIANIQYFIPIYNSDKFSFISLKSWYSVNWFGWNSSFTFLLIVLCLSSITTFLYNYYNIFPKYPTLWRATVLWKQ